MTKSFKKMKNFCTSIIFPDWNKLSVPIAAIFHIYYVLIRSYCLKKMLHENNVLYVSHMSHMSHFLLQPPKALTNELILFLLSLFFLVCFR